MADKPRRRSGKRKMKYTRSRYGCLTCRRRRVKCDEVQPVCTRCRKGYRECIYPGKLLHASPSEGASDSESSIADEISPCKSIALAQEPTDVLPDMFELSPNMTPQFDSVYDSSCEMPILHNPRSPLDETSFLFLQYHYESIIPAHYYRSYDLHLLCKRWLPSMAQRYPALQHAMIAFSALIYSLKVDPTARPFAFVHYSMALKELQDILNTYPFPKEEYDVVVATALQLSALDRHYGDTAKCFRHVENISKVMRKCSNPQDQSSTILGRVLLEWYCNFEDYLCILYPSKHFLPRVWREENVRHREQPISGSGRILDHLWPKFWAILHELADIQAAIAEREEDPSILLVRWKALYDNLAQFKKSIERMDIFRPDKTRVRTNTAPFTPYFPQFAPAGFLRLILLSSQIYLRLIVYAPLSRFDGELDDVYDETGWLAYELCRTFAGLEETLSNSDELIPAFPPLTMAAFGCRRTDIRLWLWQKLSHYEKLSHLGFQPIKHHLAVFWNMPNLSTQRFEVWKSDPPDQQRRIVNVKAVETIANQAKASLESELDEMEEISKIY